MSELRQNHLFAQYLFSLNWAIDKINSHYIYSMKLPLVGVSVTKLQRPEKLVELEALKKIVKKRKTYVVFVEPSNNEQAQYYADHGFSVSKTPSLPTKTIQIDISLSDNTIKKNLHHKTRYNIGLSQRRGVVVKNSKDIETFCTQWDLAAKMRKSYLSQKREIISIYRAFGKNAHILYAYCNDGIIGGVLLLKSQKTLYYMYAFSTPQGKSLFAPSLLVWESLLLGQKLKCTAFDFEGIYDERYPLPGWKGFTRFKKSFRGKEITYPPIYKKYFFPF